MRVLLGTNEAGTSPAFPDVPLFSSRVLRQAAYFIVGRILGEVRETTPVKVLSYGLVARSIHSMGFVPNLIAIVGAKA